MIDLTGDSDDGDEEVVRARSHDDGVDVAALAAYSVAKDRKRGDTGEGDGGS